MSSSPRSRAGEGPSAVPPRRGLLVCVRGSPWLMIALLLHALAITVLSVVVFRAQRGDEAPPPLTVAVQRAAEAPLLEEVEPPSLLQRDPVPLLAPEPVAPLEVEHDGLLSDAAPGLPGERTDELDLGREPGHWNPDPEALPDMPSGPPGGTPIGLRGPGHRGTGTPSAFVGRVAGRNGPGGGGRGDEGKNGKIPADSQRAVFAALDWLKRHQSPAGSWDCDGFTAQCSGAECTGTGSGAHDVGVTGLALLAFLGAGHTHFEGDYRATVRKGLEWLMEVQDEDGCFGPRISNAFLYDHACAALAMAEAFGMTRSKPLREPAQKAIQFVLRAQNPYSAWRYAAPGDGDDDTSVTGWMVMVLKSAQLAGLTIDDQALEDALAWIDQMTDPESGRTGYIERGGFSSRPAALAARFPAENSEAMIAVGVLVRIFAGRTDATDPLIALGAERLARCLPRWDEASGAIDFYYWYYGSLAMYQLGGTRWQRWNEALRGAVIEHQQADPKGCAFGSWEPLDPWSASGGRVYATALNCLDMEVYYRYPRVFGVQPVRKK